MEVLRGFSGLLSKKCVWLNQFRYFDEAEVVISEWVQYCDGERLHSALGICEPQ